MSTSLAIQIVLSKNGPELSTSGMIAVFVAFAVFIVFMIWVFPWISDKIGAFLDPENPNYRKSIKEMENE